MAAIRGPKGKVNGFQFEFLTAPRGPEGRVEVLINGTPSIVSWKRDRDGIWLETAKGVFGFDFNGKRLDEGGIAFDVSKRGGTGQWSGLRFIRAGESEVAAGTGAKRKNRKIKAQMPGKIIKLLVKVGDEVHADQPLLVMEAMKMENQIKAPQAGKVSVVKVIEGQSVETGAELILFGE